MVELKVDIVGHHQVDESVAIVVSEGGTGGHAAFRDAGLRCDISERAVAVVSQQHIPTEAREEKIGPAVVVVIGGGATHGEARRRQARLAGDVGKCAVVVVMVERSAS